jgi:hypothetical protein
MTVDVLPRTAPVTGGGWRRLAARSALVPLAVLAPLTTLAPTGNHRYNVYWHGSMVRNNPWTLITENLRTIPVYLDLGSFRPLGRIVEWSLDVAAYLLVEFLRLPADIALRLIAVLAAMVLTGGAVVFAEAVTARGRMFAAPPARPVTLVPFAVAGCLVAAGPASATVLFGGYHFLVAALVLGVAARSCRNPRGIAPVLIAGAALALVDDAAALALPLATVAVLARARLVLGLDRARTMHLARPVGLLWLGFLPAFGLARLLIHSSCGGCPGTFGREILPPAAVGGRLVAWLPPLQWGTATHAAAGPSPVVVLLAVVAFGVLGWRALAELDRLRGLDRGQAGALVTAGAALLMLGAARGASLPGATTEAGGPESALTAAGGALLIVGLLALANAIAVQRLAMAGLALLCALSAAANQAYTGRANGDPAALVDNAIAAEVAQFDYSDAGDARRCTLRDRFAALMPAERLDLSLDMATVQMYGEPFCRRSL